MHTQKILSTRRELQQIHSYRHEEKVTEQTPGENTWGKLRRKFER